MNVHEIEEMEYRFGPKLWDADPDVCCAAYQLGACPHTEADAFDDEPLTRAERVELYGEAVVAADEALLAAYRTRMAGSGVDEPF